jgi:hypothetical protein
MQPGADLRERNLGAIFDVILDTDRDGIIAAGDFERLAQGVCVTVTAMARSPVLSSPPRT